MSILLRTDVTSVKLFGDYILTGVGSSLNIYNRDSSKLIQKISILRGQKIYGIVPSKCNSKVLLFGGKQFSILSVCKSAVDQEISFDRQTGHIECNDWLHCGVWVSGNEVALLTAHNVVQIWDTLNQTLEHKYMGRNNSILYSGLLLPLRDDVLVFSGTVFSEVIIHMSADEKPLHYLRGHKGVIFSITCNPDKRIIVTTSDDRSVRIWSIVNTPNLDYTSKEFWKYAKINCIHELYGHSARVMRSCLTNNYIISVGEDSGICFWSYNGILIRKIISHQNASIWSLDADEKQLVTGGGDCGVNIHPLSLLNEYSLKENIYIEIGIPKKIEFTARRNLVIMNETNDLVYYNLCSRKMDVHKLNHESTYKLLSLSFCKQIIAVADMRGKLDVFIENCRSDPGLCKIIDTTLSIKKILSMHWAGNRCLVICSENGNITILASKDTSTEIIGNFILPPCKERWLTSCALSLDKNTLVVGDRCGHIHVYYSGITNPVKTFDKVHGRYGATSITLKNNAIITTGRDGTIKYFSLGEEPSETKYMNCKDVEFQWVEKFLDKNEQYISGFQERVFVIYDVKNNFKMLEVSCGGGHRAWDVVRYFDKVDGNYEEFIKFIYVKNSDIHLETFQLRKIISRNIVHGTHAKEINCLKTYSLEEYKSTTFYLSGGEDTTLKISRSKGDEFRDEVIFKQLSSIRSLKMTSLENNKILLVSAGGRAQITAKSISFLDDNNEIKITSEELVDYLIKGTDKERKGNQSWRNRSVDFDPETRIMDLELIAVDASNFIVFAACSDAVLRIFRLEYSNKIELQPVQEIRYHKTCILKTHSFKINNKNLLASCTTRGEVAFWNVAKSGPEILEASPIFVVQIHNSGINSVDIKVIDDERFLIGTGGDDNSIRLNLIEYSGSGSMKVVHSWCGHSYHCSQVTGLVFIDDLMVTTSIDQRITLFKCAVTDTTVECDYISQNYSDVADIQGLDILHSTGEFIKVCVYGKGIEVIEINKP